MCQCQKLSELVDITNWHKEFKSNLNQISVGDWVLLMSCQECGQLWKVDEWDKYQTSYAVKLKSQENWESYNSDSLIKKHMIKNRGGLIDTICIYGGCKMQCVNGVVFCIEHLWDTGARK